MMLRILLSFWEDLLSGVMLNFQGCYHVLLPKKNSLRFHQKLVQFSRFGFGTYQCVLRRRLKGDHDGLVAIFDINETISLWFACVFFCHFFEGLYHGMKLTTKPLFFFPNHRFPSKPKMILRLDPPIGSGWMDLNLFFGFFRRSFGVFWGSTKKSQFQNQPENFHCLLTPKIWDYCLLFREETEINNSTMCSPQKSPDFLRGRELRKVSST